MFENNNAGSIVGFELFNAYPNPFNPAAIIKFTISDFKNVSDIYTLKIFDINGRLVTELLNSRLSAGNYSVRFNAADLPSGVYIYRLSNTRLSVSKKLMLLK